MHLRKSIIAACAFLLGCWSTSGFAELYELQPDMPITIDADSSDFDYVTNQLVFRGLRVTQGTLSIEADLAETDKLDFNDGLWIFSGNVRVEAEGSLLACDRAELTFKENQLSFGKLTGAPAHFEQTDPATGQVNIGESNLMTYDLSAGTVVMKDDAKFTDGTNRMSGANITYDVKTRRIRVESDGASGGVKIMIDPTSPGVSKFIDQNDSEAATQESTSEEAGS